MRRAGSVFLRLRLESVYLNSIEIFISVDPISSARDHADLSPNSHASDKIPMLGDTIVHAAVA